MNRRNFLGAALAVPAALATARDDKRSVNHPPIDVRQFHAMRRFVGLRQGRIAYMERGRGPAALFLHGLPLNSYQWRGALERLGQHRRCVAPDVLGAGHTEIPEGADQTPEAQVAMLAALLDFLGEKTIDLVASDSGGALAQLFSARHPARVRSLLLTNCDTAPDCPPQAMLPLIAQAHAGKAHEGILAMLNDPPGARKTLGTAFTDPNTLTDELIEVYLRPLVQTPARSKQYSATLIALEKNVLQPIETDLRRLQAPVRILWGTGDDIFKPEGANYLDHLFAGSRGVRRIEGAKLFWPEEFPDILAEEARRLWGA
jgi:haloalkane dehalogenase